MARLRPLQTHGLGAALSTFHGGDAGLSPSRADPPRLGAHPPPRDPCFLALNFSLLQDTVLVLIQLWPHCSGCVTQLSVTQKECCPPGSTSFPPVLSSPWQAGLLLSDPLKLILSRSAVLQGAKSSSFHPTLPGVAFGPADPAPSLMSR